MSTYERVVNVLADGAWHRLDELSTVSRYPDRWLNELRRDGLEVEEVNGMVLLHTPVTRAKAAAHSDTSGRGEALHSPAA